MRTAVKSRGFTLIELLVSVAIFSGVIIIALGAFALSADSSARSSLVRERTEAARSVMDQIGNDLRYVYQGQEFSPTPNECNTSGTQYQARGLHFSDNCLFMLLLYPGFEPENGLVMRRYYVAPNGRIYIEHADNCFIGDLITCNPSRTMAGNDMMNPRFSLVSPSDAIYGGERIFSGVLPHQALNSNESAFVTVNIAVRPTNFEGTCDSSPGSCYILKSSFVPPDSRKLRRLSLESLFVGRG